MDLPQINYIHNNCLLVVNPYGKMRQLFTPFKVQVLYDSSHFKEKSWIVVEEVKSHPQYILLYRVINHWWPYYVFRIDVRF